MEKATFEDLAFGVRSLSNRGRPCRREYQIFLCNSLNTFAIRPDPVERSERGMALKI